MRIYRFIILTSQLTEVSRSSGQIKYTNDGFSNSKERQTSMCVIEWVKANFVADTHLEEYKLTTFNPI